MASWALSACRLAGQRLHGLPAPFVLDGPINRASFRADVEQVPVPEPTSSGIVVMGDLGSAERPTVRAAIDAAGTRLLFLSPYSPDFDPIAMVFAKLEAGLRKTAECRVEGLWSAIGRLIDTVAPDECANVFAAAGYGPDSVEDALAATRDLHGQLGDQRTALRVAQLNDHLRAGDITVSCIGWPPTPAPRSRPQ